MAGFNETQDATRRTRLASERTYLAWWRTGLTAFAVSIAAGKVVPDLVAGSRWPYAVLGVGYGLVGIGLLLYGERRRHEVDEAIAAGTYRAPRDDVLRGLTAAGVALGLLTVVIVIVTP
jgi:putative membrane protein